MHFNPIYNHSLNKTLFNFYRLFSVCLLSCLVCCVSFCICCFCVQYIEQHIIMEKGDLQPSAKTVEKPYKICYYKNEFL